jgi:hypothetical protein
MAGGRVRGRWRRLRTATSQVQPPEQPGRLGPPASMTPRPRGVTATRRVTPCRRPATARPTYPPCRRRGPTKVRHQRVGFASARPDAERLPVTDGRLYRRAPLMADLGRCRPRGARQSGPRRCCSPPNAGQSFGTRSRQAGHRSRPADERLSTHSCSSSSACEQGFVTRRDRHRRQRHAVLRRPEPSGAGFVV